MTYAPELLKGAMLAAAAQQGCTGADLETSLRKCAGIGADLARGAGAMAGTALDLGVAGLTLGGAGLGAAGYGVYRGVKDSQRQTDEQQEKLRQYNEATKRLQSVLAARKTTAK